MNFQQAITARGFDENRAIRNLRSRLRYRSDSRSHYYWPETATLTPYVSRYGNADQIRRDLAELRFAAQFNDTAAYASIWSRLNHLKG